MKNSHLVFLGLLVGAVVSSFVIPQDQPDASIVGETSSTDTEGQYREQAPNALASFVREEKPFQIPPQHHVEDPVAWWDDPEAIRGMTDIFAAEIPQYRADFLIGCDRDAAGDKNIKATSISWGRFHPGMSPSLEMFEGSTQGEKWVLALMIQKAGHYAREYGGVVPDNLPPERALEFKQSLRNQSLYYSPEFILNEEFGSDWVNHPALIEETRNVWIEMVRLASPVEAELNVRQRCAMSLFGNIHESQVHLVAPGIHEFETMMNSFHQEFYDSIVSLIREVQS